MSTAYNTHIDLFREHILAAAKNCAFRKTKKVPVTVIFASWSGSAAAAAVAGAGTP